MKKALIIFGSILGLLIILFFVVIIIVRINTKSNSSGPYMPQGLEPDTRIEIYQDEILTGELLCAKSINEGIKPSCTVPIDSRVCFRDISAFSEASIKMPTGEVQKIDYSSNNPCFAPIQEGLNEFTIIIERFRDSIYEVPLIIYGSAKK